MTRIGSFLAIVAVLALAGAASAQTGYTVNGGLYSQNFDSLPQTGTTSTSNPWSNNSTLAGWFVFQSNNGGGTTGARDSGGTAGWAATAFIRAGTGSSNAGALYSFGVAGTNPVTDRAMGTIGSGTPGDYSYALVLRNDTADKLDSFTLTYDGEMWRDGGNSTLAVQAQGIDFDYKVLSGAFTASAEIPGNVLAGYTNPAANALDYAVAPAIATVGSALDGNAAANRTAGITSTITGISWAPGDYLILRWWDDNHPGNDHGLAIDNLEFSATPEPATLALLGLGALLLRRRRS